MQFQRQFDSRHSGLHADIQTLEAACAETRSNALLPCVLKTCLDVGNYLNAGHRAGAAAGFQIESLLKLKAVRSSKHPGRTLLHFVARQVPALAFFLCLAWTEHQRRVTGFAPQDAQSDGGVAQQPPDYILLH